MRRLLHAASLSLFCCLEACSGKTISIEDVGAVAGLQSANVTNRDCISKALALAAAGDTVLIPSGKQFWALGGIHASNLHDVTLQIDGVLMAAADYDLWPTTTTRNKKYVDFLSIADSTNITVTGDGSGLIDGQGLGWWNKEVLPQVYGKLCCARPKLFGMPNVTDVLIEHVNLLNSPSFHLWLDDVARVEIRHVHINVDRSKQRELKQIAAALRNNSAGAGGQGSPPGLQPEDLNTDGIDPKGRDIHIHNCTIFNDDDSIAIKPCNPETCSNSDCSRNILVENMVMTGFGASIGSVPPHTGVACVENVVSTG
jgi:polygalacturonase